MNRKNSDIVIAKLKFIFRYVEMKILTILLSIGLLTCVSAQTPRALALVLKKELPENYTKDGSWVYYADKANIVKIEKPLVKAVLPNYDFYQVTLTNYLGYHINEGTCVVLFDSVKSKIVLVEPIWYGGISEPLIKLMLKKPFESKETLWNFLNELNELMEIGSDYKFVQTDATDDLIKYDLIYSKGDSYTTGGNGTSSTLTYTQDGIWRQIEIKIKNLRMTEYVSINPRLNNDKEYRKYYKEVIR